MAKKLKKTDVVVIGLGAAGGMAALGLARQNIDVIGLEAGPERSIKDFPSDEIRNDVRNHLGAVKFNKEIPTWRPDAQTPTITAPGVRMMNGVGGTSIHYSAQTWRYLPWNFRMRSETIKRYGRSAIPKNALVEDWPVSYDDLEQYYDAVEYEIGASGKAGNIKGEIDPEGNVFEGPRRREYPLPPLRWSGWTQLGYDAAKRMGLKPFRGPAGIHSEPYRGNPGCQYCGFCTTNGCHVNAKGSVFLNAIPDARKTGHLKVVANARVMEITVDGDGRASGVTYLRDGQEYHQPATVVVLATYVYENTRLLLLSKSKAHPDGLSNGNGQVGKGYMSHIYGGMNGLFPGRRLNRYGGPTGQYVAIDEYDSDNFDHKGLGFIGGASLQIAPEAKPIATAQTTPPNVPLWGPEWKAWLQKNANSVGNVFAQMEVLPYEENYLDLDPEKKDDLGRPVVRITFKTREQEDLRGKYIVEQCGKIIKEMGATETWPAPPAAPPMNSHAFGGTRMGNDADSSVVDKWSISHEVPNLAILGGSTFLSTTGRNPTQTIQALALRAGEHIGKQWSAITT